MRVAGIMSGTSLDGIDVAIVDIRGRSVSTLACRSTPYPAAVRRAVLAISEGSTSAADLARIHFQLGELYARAVRETCRRARIPLQSVQLIGSHGQTVYHEGGVCTLQIGEGAIIAERTGIPVIFDFRPHDIAAGGQGAPLVPYVDFLLYRDRRRGRVALNIGGIANVTAIPAGAAPADVVAFDTGPGNMVIDALTREHTGGRRNYDSGGRLASRGRVSKALLEELLGDAYYRRRPPKTAGREQYGAAFVARMKGSGLPLPDLVATATAMTAVCVAEGIRRFVLPRMQVDELIVSGGGAHNPRIMAHIAALLPETALATSADYGIDIDGKEAIAFAVLASETWRRRPSNLPAATGARHAAILGKIAFPPRMARGATV